MKFCRFGQRGQEKPGIVDADGRIRDLSGVVPELTIEPLAAAKGADVASLPLVDGEPRYHYSQASVQRAFRHCLYLPKSVLSLSMKFVARG